MAAYTLLIAKSGTRSSSFLHATRGCFTSPSTTINTKPLLTPPFQARSYASIFDPGIQTKYYIFGDKGGVGKTSCAASLAVKFTDRGHPTALVSTDTTHSRTLSDLFDQDLTEGAQIRGLKSPLYACEVNPGGYRKDFPGPAGFNDRMYSLGLGKLVEHLGESKCEKLFGSPAPFCLSEAVEIARVMELAESPEHSIYTRVVFDTLSKGDDLLHEFWSDSKIRDTTKRLSSLIDTDILRESNENSKRAGELFRGSTEYVITTTPTVMGVEESSRLHASLKKEKVLVRRLIVNEILPPSSTYCKFSSMKREDEMRALKMIKNDPELSDLDLIEVPLVDGEIRGIPALKSMGDFVWKC